MVQRRYPQQMAKNKGQCLYFRILELPLRTGEYWGIASTSCQRYPTQRIFQLAMLSNIPLYAHSWQYAILIPCSVIPRNPICRWSLSHSFPSFITPDGKLPLDHHELTILLCQITTKSPCLRVKPPWTHHIFAVQPPFSYHFSWFTSINSPFSPGFPQGFPMRRGIMAAMGLIVALLLDWEMLGD